MSVQEAPSFDDMLSYYTIINSPEHIHSIHLYWFGSHVAKESECICFTLRTYESLFYQQCALQPSLSSLSSSSPS